MIARPPPLLKLLAHDLRWRLVLALARSDRRVGELVAVLNEPANLVSYHLRQLRRHELVAEHRSAADGRDVYYRLRLDRLRDRLQAGAALIHPALAGPAPARPRPHTPTRATRPTRVLFLCTHNSARSQMAEALLRHMSHGRVQVASAGTEPGRLHPLAVQVMAERGLSLTGHHSQPASDYAGQRFDLVITVCDRAREVCPSFPGTPAQIHWSLPDPAAVTGTAARLRAFRATAAELEDRITYLLAALPVDALPV